MEDVLSHWPFLAAAGIFAVVGQVMKGAVFTLARVRAARGWLHHVLWWGRKTLAFHPVLAGVALGFVPGMPVSPGVSESAAAHALYFAGAGVCSTWVFALIKGLLKSRGIELEEPEAR